MRALITLVLAAVATSYAGAQADSAQLLARARAIHRAIPMIDTHNDLPGAIRDGANNDYDV